MRKFKAKTTYEVVLEQNMDQKTFKISLFLLRLWKIKLPVDDVIASWGKPIVSICRCCDQPQQETFSHFLTHQVTIDIRGTFTRAEGILKPFIQVNQTVVEWWKVDCGVKLKPLFQATPASSGKGGIKLSMVYDKTKSHAGDKS